jgi:hypothetical protein
MTFAPASAALVDGLATLGGLTLDTSDLHTAADASLRQVDELITKSSEHLELVRQLERNLDATEGNPLDLGQIPTADELGAELERYLRGERSDRDSEREPGRRPDPGGRSGGDDVAEDDVAFDDGGPLMDWDPEIDGETDLGDEGDLGN